MQEEEPYIEQECDGNLKNDERNESQDLVLDEDLARMQESVQESDSAELVYQQVSTYLNREISTKFYQVN